MFSEDWSNRMPEFREYIQRMDEIRGTILKTFPEMARPRSIPPRPRSFICSPLHELLFERIELFCPQVLHTLNRSPVPHLAGMVFGTYLRL